MIEASSLYLFIITNILLALSPGPDNIYVLTQGVTRDKKAVMVTTFGFSSGVLIHTIAATFGISVIFQTSEIAFSIVKYIGAVYLIYLAYQAYKHRNDPLDLTTNNSSKELRKLYFKGFIMNVLNPKVSIFFLAFLPQFVSPENGNIALQMMTLGIVFMIITIIVFNTIGFMGNILSSKLREVPEISTYLNTLTYLYF